MALRGKTLTGMMNSSASQMGAETASTVSFSDGKRRKKSKQSKAARRNTPNKGFKDKCFNPNY